MGKATTEADEAPLWEAYCHGGDGAREQLVERYLPFARTMAAKLYATRTHLEMEFGDYLQYARIGLIEAIDRFDGARGFKFETFAASRISGAILSGMESFTEIQQQIAARKRVVSTRVALLRAPQAAPAPDDAGALFAHLAELAIGLALGFVLDDSGMYRDHDGEYKDNTYAGVELRQLRQRLEEQLELLPGRLRHIIASHYLQQQPFEEIAETLGVSRGRVAQLHKEALLRLRSGLEEAGARHWEF